MWRSRIEAIPFGGTAQLNEVGLALLVVVVVEEDARGLLAVASCSA